MAWLPRFTGDVGYKTVTLLLVAGISFVIGGYVSGRLADRDRMWHGLALGSLLGLVAFGYVLGPHWLLLLSTALSGLLGALGGRLVTLSRSRSPN